MVQVCVGSKVTTIRGNSHLRIHLSIHEQCFKLIEGQYQEQDLSERRYWLPDMGIGLGVWHGEYEGITRPWLRWYDADGAWIPNKDERIEQERSRADRLAEKLRELGIDPEEV